MAVPEQTPYKEYTANGVTTSFALSFICDSKNDLIVLVDGVAPPIATWSLIGGNAVFNTAPASGKKIVLQRNTAMSRTTNYQGNNNSFRPETINKDIDRVWLKLQELGVADWLLRLYIDAKHQEQKEYIDQKDDELKNYLIDEIRKQGVALDQLEDYYNRLLRKLAEIAVQGGWLDSFVATWSGRTQEDHNKDWVHLKDFGARPNDPNFDNAAAIKAALESGYKIYFGDQNCIYYVDDTVSVALSSRLQYESSGAKIVCKNVVNRVISIDMDGNSIFGEGELFVDASLKSFTGIYIMNNSTRRADVVLKNPNVNNCRRSSTAFTGGDGIYVVGNLGRVLIDEPYIDGVYMAAGAGVVGSQGVSGITVVRSLTAVEYIPEMVEIKSPRIENIRSEDLSYTSDQDGIRIFTRHSQAQVLPTRTTAVITNPYFKNCIGRAVKSQGEIVTVDTPMVFRDIAGAGGNVEFDFQVGSGKLINAYCIYKNTMPTSIAYLYGSENATKNIGLQIGSIDGLNVSVEYDDPYVHIPELIKISFNNGNDFSDVLIRDVNVRGKNFKANSFLQISRVGTTPQNATVNLLDCSAPIAATGSIFTAQDGFEGYGLVVNPHRFKNTGGADCNMTSSRIQNFAAVNPLNCQGIISSTVGVSDLPANYINGLPEYGELPVVGDRRGGGNVRFGKYRLTSGLNTINIGGFASGGLRANIVLLSIARTKNHTAIISTDATGCIGLSVGSEISIGDNAPSASPKAIDVYVTNSGETLNNNNSIGGTVFLTLQMLG